MKRFPNYLVNIYTMSVIINRHLIFPLNSGSILMKGTIDSLIKIYFKTYFVLMKHFRR